jgi:uncharacterized protein (TIGR03067 family)
MFWKKCATSGMALAALSLLAAGTVLSYCGFSAMEADRAAEGAAPVAQTPPPEGQPTRKADGPGKKIAVGTDAMNIQGIWKLESRELDGRLAPAEAIKDMTLEINAKGEWKLSFGPGKPTNQALVFIDLSKKPAVMEVRGPKGKVFWSGLYKVEGDTLTICNAGNPESPPPTELKSSPEHLLWTWKRAGK